MQGRGLSLPRERTAARACPGQGEGAAPTTIPVACTASSGVQQVLRRPFALGQVVQEIEFVMVGVAVAVALGQLAPGDLVQELQGKGIGATEPFPSGARLRM